MVLKSKYLDNHIKIIKYSRKKYQIFIFYKLLLIINFLQFSCVNTPDVVKKEKIRFLYNELIEKENAKLSKIPNTNNVTKTEIDLVIKNLTTFLKGKIITKKISYKIIMKIMQNLKELKSINETLLKNLEININNACKIIKKQDELKKIFNKIKSLILNTNPYIIEKIKNSIEQNPKVLTLKDDLKGDTLLHFILKICPFVPNKNDKNSDNKIILSMLEKNFIEKFKIILKLVKDRYPKILKSQNIKKQTPLQLSSALNTATIFLKGVNDNEVINRVDAKGDSALAYAVQKDAIDSVKTLLEINPNLILISNNASQNPLHLVKNFEIMKLLIFYMKKINNYSTINEKDSNGNTPLHNFISQLTIKNPNFKKKPHPAYLAIQIITNNQKTKLKLYQETDKVFFSLANNKKANLSIKNKNNQSPRDLLIKLKETIISNNNSKLYNDVFNLLN